MFLFVPFFLHLINSSFLHGEFLADKHAIISPILKKPSLDPSECRNYRPISLLSFSSKLLESAIFSQLSPLINNVIDPLQSGFRPRHSTELLLLSLSNDFYHHFSHRRSVILVLLDMSSAFDLVDHSILLDDLSHAGLSSSALSLLKSYLSSRTYSVKFNSSFSDDFPLFSGVSQGSILGPLLFNLYMSSLPTILKQYPISFHIYADDVQFFLPCPLPYPSLISDVISAISSWAASRHLLINQSKSEFLALHPPKLSPPLLPFPLSSTVRNLGVIFDSSLSFSNNISATSRTCNLILRSLYPIRPYLDQPSAIKLVNALIFSRIDYSCSLFFHVPKHSLKILQKIINRSCRFVFSPMRLTHTFPFLFKLRWLPIIPRIHLKVSSIVFKLLHDPYQPSYLSSLLTSSSRARSRNRYPLQCPRAINESSWSSKSFHFYAPRFYNSLPSRITSSCSFSTFYASLHSYLIDMSFSPPSYCLSPYASL